MNARTKRIIIFALIGALLIGAIAGIVALTGREKADKGFNLVEVDFERGGLTSEGIYTDTKASIYTKNAFECGEGLRIKLEFDSDVNYQAYFYDDNDDFVEASGEFTKTETITAPEGATYVRLLVTPIYDADVAEDDQKVGVFEVSKYAKQLTVMVKPAEKTETETEADA